MYQIRVTVKDSIAFQSQNLPNITEAKKQLRHLAEWLIKNDYLPKDEKSIYLKQVQTVKARYGSQLVDVSADVTVRLINDGNTKADLNQLADFVREAKEHASDHPNFPQYSIVPTSFWTTGRGKYTQTRSLPRVVRCANRETEIPALKEFFINRPRIQNVLYFNREEI